MTCEGFTLLVFGWGGPRAMDFKTRNIEAFTAMEAALKSRAPDGARAIISELRTIVEPLNARVDNLRSDVEQIKHTAFAKRRRLPGRKTEFWN